MKDSESLVLHLGPGPGPGWKQENEITFTTAALENIN